MSVAAIITITLLASWMVLYHQMNTEPQSYYTCSASYGEKSKLVLTDGTSVWLIQVLHCDTPASLEKIIEKSIWKEKAISR